MSQLENLKNAFNKGKINRREFLTSLIGLGVSVTMANSIVSTAATAFAATPKKGGRIRCAMIAGGADDTLNPERMNDSTDAVRGFQVYNNLARVSPKLSPEPELAASWEARNKATEWIFELRKGVEFHNGKKLTSADVLYSFGLHRGDKSTSPAKALLESVSEIKADGPNTVYFKLNSPNADLPLLLGDYHFGIVPEGTTDFDKGIGTGPFKVKEFKPGIRLLVSRNDNFWGEGPYVDEIETFAIQDDVARANALLSGEVEIAEAVDPKTVRIIERTPGVEILSAKSGKHFTIVTMLDKEPFTNQDFRLAVKYLYPREQILKKVCGGYGQIANDHPIAPTDPFYNTELPIRAYDPDRAKFHLKKAGVDSLDMVVNTSQAVNGCGVNAVDAAVIFAEAAKAGGIKAEVKRHPADGYWDSVITNHPCYMGYWNARPSADLILSIAFLSNAKWNEARQKSETLDKLIVDARGETDFNRRKELYWEAQRIIHEEGGSGIPVFIDYQDGYSSSVKGLVPHPSFGLSGSRFSDRVWLES